VNTYRSKTPDMRVSKLSFKRSFLAALVSTTALVAVPNGFSLAGQLPISAFQAYNNATAAAIVPGPFALYSVNVNSLKPTQIDEGFAEVNKKAAGFDLLSPAQLQPYLLGYVEPVVIGPGGQLYVTDGHHTFTALSDSIYGASNPTVFVNVIANYSNMTMAQFYAAMAAQNLLLPLQNGVPQTVNTTTGAPIPTSLTTLIPDAYRGLEYSILKNKSAILFPTAANITGAVGAATPGLDKMTGAYTDFLEAAAYRGANSGLGLPYLSTGDIALATAWNLNPANTTTIPNVAGTVTVAQLPGFILEQNIVNAGGISNATLATGAMDGNGTFTGIPYVNLGTVANPINVGTPNVGFIMELGNDNKFSVTLQGTNTYTGGTSILAGNLIAQSDASVGAATPVSYTINPNALLSSVQAANGIVFNSLTEGNGTLTIGTTTGGTFATNRPIAVDGEVATINVNGNTVTLTGQLVSLGTAGVGIGNATGVSDLTIDDNSTANNGKLILSTPSPLFYGNLIIGNNGAPTVEVMSDAALGNTSGVAASIGQIELNGGILQAGASFAAPERNMFLGGGSSIDVNGFNTSWGTLTDVQRTLLVLNSNTTTAGAITFNNLTISATAVLQLQGGTAGESVTFTNGINRTANDTLILYPTSSSTLGGTEKVFSGTAAASLVNTIGPAWIVTNNGINTKGAGPYDFVTYGANGYVKATYNATTLTSGTGSSVVALAAATTATGNIAAYALNTEGKAITLGSNTLTIGNGTAPAGLILATGSAINGGTLAFGNSQGVIWLSGTNPTISSSITGSAGLTFAGSGAVAIGAAANVSGLVSIDSGTVTLSAANVFAGDVSGIWMSNVKTKPAPATLAITANNALSTLNTVGNNSAIKLSNGAALTLGDTTNNLSSTINATLTETGVAVAGALTLNGSGLVDFSAGSKGALGLVSGSSVVMNNSAQLRVAANAFANTGIAVVLNGTSQLQVAQNGGGILANTISGTGELHLIGGSLQVTGIANTYSGGTVVETGSILDITTANLPAINPNITNAGGLVQFDQTASGTYAGIISDGLEMGTGPSMAGSLVKDDSTGANGGNVTLTQAQTYTGTTTIEAGTLTLAAVDTVASSSRVDLGRVGGGATATLALNVNNAIQALTDEAGNTTAVLLNANQLTITNGAGSFAGVISGSGGLTVSGGTQTLAGVNSFTGATTINTGASLTLTGSGSVAAASGVTDNGTFDISATTSGASIATLTGSGTVALGANTLTATAASGTFAGTIAGTNGGFTVSGGNQTLSGVNTYTGATTVASGATLTIGTGGSVSASSGVATNGTLNIAATTSGTSVASLSGNGTVALGSKTLTLTNAIGTFAGGIGGSGGLTVSAGTETLTASNSYTGATTIAANAILALHGTGSIASTSGVIDNGIFDISATTSGASVATLSGNGQLNLGAENLTLTAAAGTFTGAITGTGGLLVSSGNETFNGTLNLPNGLTVNAGVGFANSGSLMLSNLVFNGTGANTGSMTATGGITFGAGASLSNSGIINSPTLTFNGTGSNTGTLTATGTITIGSGGFLSDNGTLNSPVLTVAGELRGTGTVNAPTTVNGKLAPGNSPGTLTFNAPVTLTGSATSEFDIDGTGTATGAGNFSRVIVRGAGNTYTAAGVLQPLLRGITGSATNLYTPPIGQEFIVVTAQGGISGSFASLAQPASGLLAGTRFDAVYAPTTVSLAVTPAAYGNLAAAGLSETPTQAAVGGALDAIRPAAGLNMNSNLAGLFYPLYATAGSSIAPALQQLSPAIYGDSLLAARQSWYAMADTVTDQIAARRANIAVTPTTPGPNGSTIWMSGVGQFTNIGSAGGTPGHQTTLGAAMAGIDMPVAPGMVAGLAVGGGSLQTTDGGARDNGNATQFAAYGGSQSGIFFGDAQLAYSHVDHETHRNLSVLGGSSSGDGSQNGGGGQVHGGLHLSLDDWQIEPAVGLSIMSLASGPITERTGGSFAQQIGGQSLTSTQGLASVRVGRQFSVTPTMPVYVYALAGWEHEYGTVSANTKAAFQLAPSTLFSVASAPIARDAARLGGGFSMVVSPSVSLFATYQAELGNATTYQNLTGGIRVVW